MIYISENGHIHRECQISKKVKNKLPEIKIFLKKIFNFDFIEKSLNEKNLKMPMKAQFFHFRYRFAEKIKIKSNLQRSHPNKK